MVTFEVKTLLGAVRRRLWRDQFVAALRLALWGAAGLLLLAVAVHLVARRVPAGAVLSALAVLWASMLARAGWRRPSDPACALWADRHLGGACAFTTLLDVGRGQQGATNVQAVRWLEEWATAKVPDCLRLLAERQRSARLSRPLLSTLVCTALATLVLTLPDLSPSTREHGAAPSATSVANRPTSATDAPVPAEFVSEIASALRDAESRDAPERHEGGRSSAAGAAGNTDDGTASQGVQAGAPPAGERAAARDSSFGSPVDAASSAGTAQAAGAAPGSQAGDSRDDRADVGVSRALRGTIPMQRFDSRARLPSPERRADLGQLATYDDELSRPGGAAMKAGPIPAAATPPPATESTRLTPTQTSYVQAWMKASGQRR